MEWREKLSLWLSRLRGRFSYVLYGIKSGRNCSIGPNVRFVGARRRIRLGNQVTVQEGSRLIAADSSATLEVGDGTVIQRYVVLDTGPGGRISLGPLNSVNPFSVLYGHGGLVTGRYVRIAAQTVIIPANHRFSDPTKPIAKQGLDLRGITIKDDVWIAAGVKILDGVTIGRGAVIAAGAVVNCDVAEMTLVAGVPARLVRHRSVDANNIFKSLKL